MNLGGGRGVGSMPSSGSGPTRKPGDDESEDFPAGLRVLVVDDDPTCLKILERMLVTCRYEVTKCNRVEYALNELRSNRNGFDVVISDVHMPNMDGFNLLEYVGLEMDLPVIMMSADDSKNVVMKGVKHGACDYLIKPVRMDALKNIWQHVVRRKKNEWYEFEPLNRGQKHNTNEGGWKSSKRKGDDEEADEKDDCAYFKKQRVVWSVELHQQFVAAVNHLGIDKAVPKKILDLMNVPGLTRENVGSHLQKYRICLRKLTGESQHFGGMDSSFLGPPNLGFGGIDLQTLTGYQPTIPSILSMPVHQPNTLAYDTTNFSFSDLQKLRNTSNRSDCLPHGMTNFYQSADSLGNTIFTQPFWSNGARIAELPRNCSAENDQRVAYSSHPQENLPGNHDPEILPHFQEGVIFDKNCPGESDPNYDTLNDLSQPTPQVWQPVTSSSVGIQENSFLQNISASPLKHEQEGNIWTSNSLVVNNILPSVNPVETAQEASSASNQCNFEFDQDYLFGILPSQEEGDISPVEGEFKFDAYALEDLL